MRILLVSSSSGSRGGGEFYLHSLAQGLTQSGHTVITAMSSSRNMDELADQFISSSLNVVRIPYKNTYQRKLRCLGAIWACREIKQLRRILKEHQVDLIHVNQQCMEDGLDLLLATCGSKIPTVSTVHVTRSMKDLGAAGGTFRDWISRRTFQQTQTSLIAISQVSAVDLARFINHSVPLDSSLPNGQIVDGRCPVYAVPNGVLTPPEVSRKKLRDAWNIPENAIVLGCVARIEQQKNPLFLVPLLKNLPEHVHFVWIGDGREREKLETAIEQANLNHRAHLTGWQTEASSQIAGFDVFVLPSLYEGLPLALLEAMALGIPAVASAVDGIQDAIEDRVSGFFCPVNDIKAWSETLQMLCNSPSKRQQIGNAAKLRHQQHFSLEAMAQRTLQVYEDVIQEFPQSQRSERLARQAKS